MIKVKLIKVEPKYGIPSIDNIVCTYGSKEIRKEIEDLFKINPIFPLPDKYTFEVLPSGYWGKVAKIILK